VIPEGTFLSGALFFKPKTNLYLSKGAVLKGSDNIADYPIMASRMEGQNLDYYPALVNAYGVNGFSISGKGTIDGNGLKYWESFWQRRKENPKCTNLEVSRPRLLFIRT
jgi:polygalacturonase